MSMIGNIDDEKSMFDQIDEYGVVGYDVKDLKPDDKEFIHGMAWMVDVVDQYEPIISTGSETIDNIVADVFDKFQRELVEILICEIGDMLFSIMDNDEYYWEEDEAE